MILSTEANIENNFQIEDFQNEFGGVKQITTSDIFHFFRSSNPNITPSTVNWRVYDLINKGILHRVSRGNFSLGNGKYYLPNLSDNLKLIYNQIKEDFPYTDICIWHSDFIKEFIHNQINYSFTVIEVERDAVNAIFLKLKDLKKNVYLNPNPITLNNLNQSDFNNIVLIPLISESPTLKINTIKTITLEKLLVDLYSDKTWSNLQGYEYLRLFETAINKYTILNSKLLRYASRKGKKEELIDILKNYNMAIKSNNCQ